MTFTDILKDMVRPVPAHERAGAVREAETPIGAAADGGEKGIAEVSSTAVAGTEVGVSNIAATQSVWGKKGFYLVCMG